MNSKYFKLATMIVIIIVIAGIGWYQSVEADSSPVPGNVDDPIVTKSYVDQAIAKSAGGTGDGGEAAKLEVVTVPWGSRIVVQDGGELIIRTGKAIVYSADQNGLSDLTDGLDLAPGKPVAANHLLLSPRGERGVEPDPTQTKGIIVLVRGGYKIE